MLVSILHRVTGSGLATIGSAILVWWLVAAASGPEAYATFTGFMGWLVGADAAANQGAFDWACYAAGVIVGVGLVWAFFQHTLSGLRHFVMDIGAGYELRTNKFWAVMTIVGALLLTALTWAWIVFGRAA
jgi:succinate dehydrogenase / fumarate reductase cytochrome b subunit